MSRAKAVERDMAEHHYRVKAGDIWLLGTRRKGSPKHPAGSAMS
jgi:hypothetical protein